MVSSQIVVDGVSNAVDPFIAESLANLQAGKLSDDETANTHAQLFVCGAIIYLANYDDVDKESTNKLVNSKLIKHFHLGSAAIDVVVNRINNISAKDSGHIFLLEGASALRRWVAHDDKSASLKLEYLLQ